MQAAPCIRLASQYFGIFFRKWRFPVCESCQADKFGRYLFVEMINREGGTLTPGLPCWPACNSPNTCHLCRQVSKSSQLEYPAGCKLGLYVKLHFNSTDPSNARKAAAAKTCSLNSPIAIPGMARTRDQEGQARTPLFYVLLLLPHDVPSCEEGSKFFKTCF